LWRCSGGINIYVKSISHSSVKSHMHTHTSHMYKTSSHLTTILHTSPMVFIRFSKVWEGRIEMNGSEWMHGGKKSNCQMNVYADWIKLIKVFFSSIRFFHSFFTPSISSVRRVKFFFYILHNNTEWGSFKIHFFVLESMLNP
jgi:hypothetical protein